MLERLIAEDIIEPVEGVGSRWVSPIVIVPKANGEVRMCIDMRQANEANVRERYPIPTVQEMLAEMDGEKVFSKLDLRQGFFQCELEPNLSFTSVAPPGRSGRLEVGESFLSKRSGCYF